MAKSSLVFVVSFIIFLLFMGRNLNPWNKEMFTFHDETQAARLQQYHLNVNNLYLPPRIAPSFSFHMGYPVFNYYAPFPYMVAELWQQGGMNEMQAIKLTFITALIVGFIGMYLFLRSYIEDLPALVGAALYASSPYIAVDIFVRGNMGELWVFALLPLALYFIAITSKKNLAITIVILSFLYTSHNILSLISLPITIIFAFITQKKTLNSIAIGMALLLSSYFFLPLIFEFSLVNATKIATITQYDKHFLCISQLWSSTWGFAGSAEGCTQDGMSFMLGKFVILFGFSGLILTAVSLLSKKHAHKNISLFIVMILITVGSVFMTLPLSYPLWKLFEPILSIFQFPWRFLMFALFGLSFFSAVLLSKIPKQWSFPILGILIIFILFFNKKYFYGQYISHEEYIKRYLSNNYVQTQVAYKVPEYLPASADYNKWKQAEKDPKTLGDYTQPVLSGSEYEQHVVENSPFSRIVSIKGSRPAIANIHYAPYWKIVVDDKTFIPTYFDLLGRPLIPISANSFSTIHIFYEQTPIERAGNLISLLTAGILIAYTLKHFSSTWNITTKKI